MKKLNLLMLSGIALFGAALNVNAACTENCMAQIGTEKYAELKDAVDAVPTDGTATTIKILMDRSTPGFDVVSGKNIIFEFDNHTVTLGKPLVGSTGTETNSVRFLKGSTITLTNGTLKPDPAAKIFIQNYSNLTVKDMTLDAMANTYKGLYALSNNNGKVNVIGNTSILTNEIAMDAYDWPKNTYKDGTQITIDTTGTIKGTIEMTSDKTRPGQTLSTITILNVKHEGEFSIESGLEDKLTISGGTYSVDVKDYLKDNTLVTTKTENGYVVEEFKTLETTDKDVAFESEDPLQNNYVLVVENAKETLKEEEVAAINVSVEETIAKIAETNKATATNINLLALYDIKVSDGTQDVKMENGKYTITLVLDENLLSYNNYKVVYIDDTGKAVETLPATVNGGKVSFTTTHLSTYGVVGYNETAIENPKTFDGVLTYVFVGILSIVGIGATDLYFKKRMN